MIDPEVARLRRLRNQALLVRQIARALASSGSTGSEAALESIAGVGWRIARVVSGRLRSHPYAGYQKGASVASQWLHRLRARCFVVACRTPAHGLYGLHARLRLLGHGLDDAVALAWSSDFSAALARALLEIKTLVGSAQGAPPVSGVARAKPSGSLPLRAIDDLGAGFEADWPYLAL